MTVIVNRPYYVKFKKNAQKARLELIEALVPIMGREKAERRVTLLLKDKKIDAFAK